MYEDSGRSNEGIFQTVMSIFLLVIFLCLWKIEIYGEYKGYRSVGTRVYNFWLYLKSTNIDTERDIDYLLEAADEKRSYGKNFIAEAILKLLLTPAFWTAISAILGYFFKEYRDFVYIIFGIGIILISLFGLSAALPLLANFVYDNKKANRVFVDDLLLIRTYIQKGATPDDLKLFFERTEPVERLYYFGKVKKWEKVPYRGRKSRNILIPAPWIKRIFETAIICVFLVALIIFFILQ